MSVLTDSQRAAISSNGYRVQAQTPESSRGRISKLAKAHDVAEQDIAAAALLAGLSALERDES